MNVKSLKNLTDDAYALACSDQNRCFNKILIQLPATLL